MEVTTEYVQWTYSNVFLQRYNRRSAHPNNNFDYKLYITALGWLLGSGCYFAVKSNYSSQDHYSPSNSKGVRYIILARVVTGEFCVGKSSLKSAPYKDGSATEQYESVVDDESKPSMYCVFNDSSAYPEYIIKYKYWFLLSLYLHTIQPFLFFRSVFYVWNTATQLCN